MWPKASFDQISNFIVQNCENHVKVQAESFHLNGHIIGFRRQTQKLESPYKTPSNTLAVKGLSISHYLKMQSNRDSFFAT